MTFDLWLREVETTKRGGMPGGGRSPYKPLLLAAIVVQIAKGRINSRVIVLDEATRSLYRHLREMAFPEWSHRDDAGQPFVRLAPEVWKLQPTNAYADEFAAIFGAGTDWTRLLKMASSAALPEDVFVSLQNDAGARGRLIAVLLGHLVESNAEIERLAGFLGSDQSVLPVPEEATSKDILLERVVEERIVADWASTPFAEQGVVLHTNARGQVVGQQFPAGPWAIDLLGWQESHKCWWVIELKRGRASDRVVGQISTYLGWVNCHLTRLGESTRGVILAKSVSPRLKYACDYAKNIEAWTFNDSLEIHAA